MGSLSAVDCHAYLVGFGWIGQPLSNSKACSLTSALLVQNTAQMLVSLYTQRWQHNNIQCRGGEFLPWRKFTPLNQARSTSHRGAVYLEINRPPGRCFCWQLHSQTDQHYKITGYTEWYFNLLVHCHTSRNQGLVYFANPPTLQHSSLGPKV